MPSSRRKRKPRIVPLRIAKQEWTEPNADLAREFIKTQTFSRLMSILHGYLVQNILSGANDDYRRGYLACIEQLSAFGNEAPVVEDDTDMTTMQGVDEIDFS